MPEEPVNATSQTPVDQFLSEVTALMADTLKSTSLGFLVDECSGLLATGKMLRSRMAHRIGAYSGTPRKSLVHASAAVELIHSASLLHDDVIDGGLLRRGVPSFWVDKGVSGAILLGDMLLFKALDLICQVESGRMTHMLVKKTGELCEAESEQELILPGTPSRLDYCIRIARYKTGALFAFIGFACASDDTAQQEALTEAGYAIGTAYQLADDILDATGDPDEVGKTLGTDKKRSIITAADLDFNGSSDPIAEINRLCESAREMLAPWPALQDGVNDYLQADIQPALDKLLDCVSR